MIGSYLRLIAYGFVLLTLQVVLVPLLSIYDIKPDFLLIFVLILTETRGYFVGTIVGFLTGLSMDLLSAGPLGVMALSMTTVGFWAGYWLSSREGLIPIRWWVLMVLLCGIFKDFLASLYLLQGSSVPLMTHAVNSIIPASFYTAVIAMLWILSPIGSRSRFRVVTAPRLRRKARGN